MKTVAIAILVLGISLFNVLRLQTRADDRPQRAVEEPDNQIVAEAPNSADVAVPKQAVVSPFGTPRQAIVDLRYVLLNTKEFRREKEKLKSDLKECERIQGEQEAAIWAAQKRADVETNELSKELLFKGITQKKTEIIAAWNENTRKLAEREKEIHVRAYDKVIAEISYYAKEHNILVVRRVDLGLDRGDRQSIVRAHQTTPAASRPALGPAPFPLLRNQPDQKAAPNFSPPSWAPASATFPREKFSQEVVYVQRGSDEEFDISDEILKRLNSTDKGTERDSDKKRD